ncbi:hypothetical protein ccbrp13_36980 [Ktedonobacteria bacterium brp13]|nr:hypothetical protein ccbrp13_36980 [Ktedonobacteria bacterium brp13]
MNYSNPDDTEHSVYNDDNTTPDRYAPDQRVEPSVNNLDNPNNPGGYQPDAAAGKSNSPRPTNSGEHSEDIYREYSQPNLYREVSPAAGDVNGAPVHPVPPSDYPDVPDQGTGYRQYGSGERSNQEYPGSVYPESQSRPVYPDRPGSPDQSRPATETMGYGSGPTYYNNSTSSMASPLQTPPPVRNTSSRGRGGANAFSMALLAIVLLLVLGVGLFAGWQFRGGQTVTGSTTSGIQTVAEPPLKSTDLEGRREEVIARIRPAVVQINVTTSQGAALGSGVIIDKRGYIVTNDHVVAGVSTVDEVVLSDGTSIKNAPVVGVDQQDDLAVIKINPPSNLVAAPLGDSSALQVGQDVMAIGSPLGNTQTVTSGIISALDRNVNEGSNGANGATLPGTIQTDAPINPGNSGGALVDLNGNLVGIPTLTAVDPEFNAPANGVGFAIPSNRVKFIADQLIATGKVSHTGRAAIGISPVTVDQNLQAQGNLPSAQGVLIYQLVAGGAADKAGLKAGDVIVQINGKAINSISDLEDSLLSKNPGDTISVKFARGNQQSSQQFTYNVKLGELQANNG